MPRFLVYLLLALAASFPAHGADPDAALAPLLEGEFALQGGDTATAAMAYLRAAQASTDPDVAERAVQVALLARRAANARLALERWAELVPDARNLPVQRLRLALLESSSEDAMPLLDLLLAREDGWRPVAAALVSAPDAELAGELASSILSRGALPDVMDAWLAFGGVALRLGDKALYSRLAQAVVQKFPQEPRAFGWAAEDALDKGDRERARSALDTALGLPELTASDRLAIASHLAALGDPSAAAQALGPAADDDRALAARAGYLAQAMDTTGLAALYDDLATAAQTTEPSSSRLLLLGQLAEMKKDSTAARDWYQRIQTGMQYEQAQLRIAVLLDEEGDWPAAQERLRQIQAGESEWDEIVRNAYLIEAELARKHGDAVSEVSALDRGLAIFDEDLMLRYNRALAYERLDRVDEAIADLRALVDAEPEDADFLNALGYTLADRTDAIDEGLALIEQSLAIKPDSAAALDSLGWALHRLGRNTEALVPLRRAFELQRDAEIGAHLAIVLTALDQPEEARSMLRLATEIDPDSRAVRDARKVLGE